VLSDILQSGKDEQKLYQNIADLVKQKGVDKIIGIGEAIAKYASLFNIDKVFYPTTEAFLQSYKPGLFANQTILLKGARVFGFERINKLLQQKAHQTVLEINLNAIVNNYNYYRSKLNPNCKIMAMVKAFSYGSGSFEIANILQFHQVDYLAVAYADEGIELRKAGITLPIMVMNPEEQSFDAIIQYNLEPEIYSFKVLNLFLEALARKADFMDYPIHVKLDTGMHRLGFEQNDIAELIAVLKTKTAIKLKSVFSHLAGSDENQHDDFTKHQISLFTAMSEKVIKEFNYYILKHILNSAGITRFAEAQFDMVRLGIGLYGISADKAEQKKLQNVGVLKTTISQIKHITKGETIGYSRKGFVATDITIATVAIGYADGLSRRLSNGKGKMYVNGKLANIIGNVCMDMCMLDITEIAANEGDEVIVFNDADTIADLAKDMDTIAYEVLTNVSQRVKRVYFQE
jgi:alanine racemase